MPTKKYRFPATIELEVQDDNLFWTVVNSYKVYNQQSLELKMVYLKSMYKTDKPYRIFVYFNSRVNALLETGNYK